MQREGVDPRRPVRQDTFDMRNQVTIVTDDAMQHSDDSGDEHDDERMDDDEDDMSSELSVPDESINFDLVYAIRTFAATVDGQANVFKGDSLVLMDDSNSYWWLVQVLKTNEVGYIPAEIIETPFERLARLNKHRNQDVSIYLCLPSQALTFAGRSTHGPRLQRGPSRRQSVSHIKPAREEPQRARPPLGVLHRRKVYSHLPARCVERGRCGRRRRL